MLWVWVLSGTELILHAVFAVTPNCCGFLGVAMVLALALAPIVLRNVWAEEDCSYRWSGPVKLSETSIVPTAISLLPVCLSPHLPPQGVSVCL